MSYEKVPEKEIFNRIEKLKDKLKSYDIPHAIIYYPINCYYFTGANQDGILLVSINSEPIFFVKRDFLRAKEDSSIKNIVQINSIKDIKNYCKEKRIGIEFNTLTVSEYLKFKNILNAEFVDISPIINELRAIKSEYEINLMRKAGEIGKKVFEESANFLKENLTEIEFAGIMEMLARKYGHEGILRTGSFRFESYTSHIMSGSNGTISTKTDTPTGGLGLSPAFPCGASFKKIKKGEPILVDFGICYMGYQVDETRMFVIGDPEVWFIDAYSCVREIENEIYNKLYPEINGKEIFEIAVKKAEELGYGEYFLGYKKKHNFIGHGIGLHTSETPIIAKNFDVKIKENMTIAFEPKMVLKNKAGIGIENTIVVRKKGVEKLTPIQEEIFVIK